MRSRCCDCGRSVEGAPDKGGLVKVEIGRLNGRSVTSRVCRDCYEAGEWGSARVEPATNAER